MKNLAILVLFSLILTACTPPGVGQVVDFERPDIRDDFCGVVLNFQYCKCAFHNEYCEAIGLSKSAANTYVQAEYDKWVAGLIDRFLEQCTNAGGIAEEESCTYCEEGFVVDNNQCVAADEVKAEFVPDGPLSQDCTIKQDDFDRGWKKYSDIDNAIPYQDRSWEAKNAVDAYDQMIELMIAGFELERDYEIEQQLQAELETYKAALVQNIKTNLLKAFWRLSWVTYTTVKGGKGLGESYNQVLTSGASVETLGAGLKVVQGIIPGDSALAIDTSTTGGKAASVGASVALEAIDTLGDPTKIATELFKSAASAPLPSADISQEEIDILKQQHLDNGIVDQALAESRADNGERLALMNDIEQQIANLQIDIDRWEGEEKARVAVLLEESCKILKQQFEQGQ
jgi:hypothetical protein